MNETVKKPDNDQAQELCAYAVMPFTECYCHSINSKSIPKITKYCMEGNNNCPIYKKIAAGKVKLSGQN